MVKFCQFLFRIIGWKSVVTVDIPDKCIICVAPHTSNWDFILGKIFYKSIGGKPHFLMKKDWFFFPLGCLLKFLGGIPVDRKNKTISLTEQMIAEFTKRDHFQLAIAPEGTRGKNNQWKKGFYYMALGAGVPIALAYIDYSIREIGITRLVIPTGDEEKEISGIKQYYARVKGKYPDKFEV